MLSLAPSPALRGSYVRTVLAVIAWAMLRVRNEHSQAFRGRYSPEAAPWGVEIVESQYWPHVRHCDVIGSNQIGKSFHATELPTLYDLAESRETVFYMNGSADNALNLWSSRWEKTLRADPVLRQQLRDRMEAGRWDERHFTDGGVLYSAGPDSAAALSQRESRVVRCSELEKTKAAVGNEASSFALACDRAGAYPATKIIVTDCTITVREGLSWRRFCQGDRSRPFIPCPACGHYACPAAAQHLDEADLALTPETVHFLEIPELAKTAPSIAAEQAFLKCNACGSAFSQRGFREALRAVVWVPVGAKVVREERGEVLSSPSLQNSRIPRVSWLDALNRWAAQQMADADVYEGLKNPAPAPEWTGPRLPDGVRLVWTPESPVGAASGTDAEKLPAFRQNPLEHPSRSFWIWRIFAPKYSIGQVAAEIVAGELMTASQDIDDLKQMTQKTLVLPWAEPKRDGETDLHEDAVLACVRDLPRDIAPAKTIGITAAIDVGDNEIHWGKRAWTETGETYLVNHGVESTGLRQLRTQKGIAYDPKDQRFLQTREAAVLETLDRIWAELMSPQVPDELGELHELDLCFIDAGHMRETIIGWCADKRRVRACKGLGSGSWLGRRRLDKVAGQWNDACEKRAALCVNAKGLPLRHQYYDVKDVRGMKLMFLDADHWKREVHNGITGVSLSHGKGGWFFLHNDVKRLDRYVSQVLAERWESWTNPRTGRDETGWREYQGANHLLDVEALNMAAASALGFSIGRKSGEAVVVAKKPAAKPRSFRPPAPGMRRADPAMG